jgi:hypothetical protein
VEPLRLYQSAREGEIPTLAFGQSKRVPIARLAQMLGVPSDAQSLAVFLEKRDERRPGMDHETFLTPLAIGLEFRGFPCPLNRIGKEVGPGRGRVGANLTTIGLQVSPSDWCPSRRLADPEYPSR